MNSVLVVDDSILDRRHASVLLSEFGLDVLGAENGVDAIRQIEQQRPDLVLTDLQMPEMNGFELVTKIHRDYPKLPVVLMTAYGSEDIAVKALQLGAASYVPKHKLGSDLVETVRRVLAHRMAEQRSRLPIEALTYAESRFQLGPKLESLDGMISHLQNCLEQLRICGEADLVRVGTALHEAVVNASEHGNLEVSSELRESDTTAYHDLVKERGESRPYNSRSVHVTAVFSPLEARFQIRDEGPGFDPSQLPDPTDPENLGKVSGRGLFLIRTFMDDVSFNDAGNQITMIKQRNHEPTPV